MKPLITTLADPAHERKWMKHIYLALAIVCTLTVGVS